MCYEGGVLLKKRFKKKVNNRLNSTVVIGLAYFVETYCNKNTKKPVGFDFGSMHHKRA